MRRRGICTSYDFQHERKDYPPYSIPGNDNEKTPVIDMIKERMGKLIGATKR